MSIRSHQYHHRLLLASLLGLATAPVTAHHSLAPYDMEREITVQGEITRFDWTNPHVYIYVETEDSNGALVEWAIQGPLLSYLSKLGWSSTTLSPGDQVTVVAHPSRASGRNLAYGESVLKQDGTFLDMPTFDEYPALTALPATQSVASELNGQWLVRWDDELALELYQPLTFLSLTPEGISAVERYSDAENPAKDCVPSPLPWSMLFPTLTSIELGDDVTIIRAENPLTRTVHMDLRSHDGAERVDNGHSIGWLEGNALVIDTTRFAEHRRGNAFGLPSGPRKHLVERFELNEEGTGLTYSFRLEDPDYLAQAVTGTLEFVYRPDLPFVDAPCDPEAAGRFLDP